VIVRRLTAVLSAGLAATLLVAAAPAATDPEPGSPAWVQRDLDNVAASAGRLVDEQTNPAFHQQWAAQTPGTFAESLSDQLTHPDRPIVSLGQLVPGGRTADPFRVDWAQRGRGTATPIEYHNRYGARITGTMWAPSLPHTDPLTGRTSNGPFPTVLITTGSIQGFEEMYLWAAQGLAEAGYVVMTYDVQGQGQSEVFGHHPDGSLWCDGAPGSEACPGVPFQQEANFVEGTEDALLFLLSDANPLRGLVDEDRLGLAGHSLGATAVTRVGNRPQPVPDAAFVANGFEPFPIDVDAVVAWDNANLGADQQPRVPTMGQSADYFFAPEPSPTEAPDPEADTATYRRFVGAGVDAMQVALASSTHLEWTYIPYILPASSEGERVAMHYTLAWMDRYVKGSTDGLRGPARRATRAVVADATARLTATTFDGSADASAIGAGTWDPATGTNVPHTISGDTVAGHLSIYHRSAYAFDGHRCDDMRTGC
jgi:dienelactone hydrolase